MSNRISSFILVIGMRVKWYRLIGNASSILQPLYLPIYLDLLTMGFTVPLNVGLTQSTKIRALVIF